MKLAVTACVTLIAALATMGCSGETDASSKSSDALGAGVLSKEHDGPTENFAKVSETLYRGGRPDLDGLRKLKEQFHIKTVVSLEMPDYVEASPHVIAEERENATNLGMRFVHLPITSFDPALRAGFDERIDEIEAALADTSRGPVYVHCRRGKDRTGLTVGIYRVERQGWTPRDAHAEMMEMGFLEVFLNLDLYFKLKTGWWDQD